MKNVTIQNIEAAKRRITPHIYNTPLIKSHWLSEHCSGEVYLKLESEQITGSFKARGSLNKLMWLNKHHPHAFPVTVSSGNHALGVARALSVLSMDGLIFLPTNTDPSKVEALKTYDASIEFYGDNYDACEAYALHQANENDWTYVSPYNDAQVIAGQGTIAMEITEQLHSIDNILATVGGGGLISGLAIWMNEVSPHTKMIGCQPEKSPEMSMSVKAGSYQQIESKPTLSDGSAGGFEPDAITFELCKILVDDFILASETEIKEAIYGMINHHHKLIEGAAGVAIASLLKNPEQFEGQKTVIVVCGTNISPKKLRTIL